MWSAVELALDKVPGVAPVTKYGRNTDIDTAAVEDVWDVGGTWVAPTQARIHQIVSTDAADAAAGGGARTVRVYGLTSWTTIEVSEVVTMNGTTDVPTVNAYVMIHRIRVITKGATAANVGAITATADVDATVTAQIMAGKGSTEMAVYGVPSIQTLAMKRLYGNINKRAGGAAADADVFLLANPEPADELLNFVTRHTFGLVSNGTSASSINYAVPKVIVGPAIVKISAGVSVNDADIIAGFDALLIDNRD